MITKEFDKDKLLSALKDGIDINDCSEKDLNQLMLNCQEELNNEVDDLEASLNLSSIGGEYKIGPFDVNIVLGNLVLLSAINSPLVSGELEQGDTLSFDDCIQAIYVLCKGKEAIRPIMNIKQRISDLMLLKPLVKENPELADRIVEKAEEISNARILFAEHAIEFWDEYFVGENFEEIINNTITIITDIFRSSDILLDSKSEKNIKQTSGIKKKV